MPMEELCSWLIQAINHSGVAKHEKNVDAEHIRAAFKATQEIAEHEFEPCVIDASQVQFDAMIERIASGKSSFEEEDAVLMMRWRVMNI